MKIRLGTRGSRLALVQTELAEAAIKERFPDAELETVRISTRGDRIQNIALSELGGTGVFAAELEKALLDGRIDIAVHSAKDLPVKPAQGLDIQGVLKRGDCRDAVITPAGQRPENRSDFIIGTGSVRRRMSMKRFYPNIGFEDIRGNVDTRIGKLLDGDYNGLILAMAGLERLGIIGDKSLEITPFNCHDFLPAPCQGIIALETRENELCDVIGKINDEASFLSFQTERYVMELLDAPCSVPLGAWSRIESGMIHLTVSRDAVNTVTGEAEIDDRFLLAEGVVNRL